MRLISGNLSLCYNNYSTISIFLTEMAPVVIIISTHAHYCVYYLWLRKWLHWKSCTLAVDLVTSTTVSEEYIVKQWQVMNETELVELREQKTVKNVLKSSSWGLLATAVREKHFRIIQEMKTEKEDSKASSNHRFVG